MLYVFLVDTGTVLTFDMNLALETVANLKEVVHKACKIPPEKQVMLISGGQSLEPSHRVCSYSAGTDTNPIFLFCKSTIESSVPPSPSIDFGSAQDLKHKVEACLSDRETTYQTVVARAQLAQQLSETAKEISRVCEQLVHDQHMQQQGWSAVVANLEDVVVAFKGRTELFEQTYQQYLCSREENLNILSHFWEDLNVLAVIPVLPCLLNQAEEMPLLDWIHSNDDENTNLNVVADHCNKALEQMDTLLLEALEKQIETVLSSAERPEMKEIGGLEERLYGLEQLLVEARKKVLEQAEMAQAFQQNQQRARNLNDASILPDLCASHRQQLKVMLRNDEKLRDIRSRCIRAKEELSANLHTRLGWMLFVQRQLSEVDSRLVLQNENLRRLRRHFDLLRQLHRAPTVYLRSMVEIVRRKHFANKFVEWAETLSGYSRTVHQDEAVKRKGFTEACEGHFLTLLFPGIVEQFSPSFATSPPSPFDTNLPPVTIEDLERLKNALPTLWATLQLPNNIREVLREPPMLERLHSSALKLDAPTELQVETGVLPSLSAALLSPPVRPSRSKVKRTQSDFHSGDYLGDDSSISISRCRDDTGLELQRQLEETVKSQRCRMLALQSHLLCALESGQAALPAFRSEMTSIRKLTTECKQMAIDQLARLRIDFVNQIHLVFTATEKKTTDLLEDFKCKNKLLDEEKQLLETELLSARRELDELRNQSIQWQEEKKELITSAQVCLQQRQDELEQQRNDQLQNQQLKFSQEIEALKEAIKVTEEKCKATVSEWQSASEQENPDALRTWKQELMLDHEVELEQLKVEKDSELNGLLQLQNQMSTPDAAEWKEKYERLLKDSEMQKLQIQEELQRKHRLEIEGLRSRFRIMASVRDRSPSDTSLDKFEMRTTPPASPCNLGRTKRLSESHSDELLQPLVEKLKREKEKLSSLVESFTTHYKTSNGKPTKWEEALSEALRESNQMIQCVGTKVDQLRQETAGSQNRPPPSLTTSMSQVSSVNMAASVAVLHSDEKSTPASPLLTSKASLKKKPMNKMTRSLVRQGSANVYGCEIGDAVVVQWDERYSTHILYNKGPYLHFLHADSISSLGLQNVMEPFLARVIQREFCLVRKEENRYNLPKGTNFYRVKVEKIITT